jgi:hypothetical protein
MKRIIHDIPKWSLYLHRAARGLPRADANDAARRKLEDELFERLFAGELEPLPDSERDRGHAEWAQRVHDTMGQLPAFERLAAECRGRSDEAAMAVEALMNELRGDGSPDELRRLARIGCTKAGAAVDELREAMAGLEHVAFGAGVESSPQGAVADGTNARSLAARLRDSGRLRAIAKLAGRFKRIAGTKRRSRVKHGADEIVDVEQGADLGRLLPLELAMLVHPTTKRLSLRNLVERSCLQYRLVGTETLGKGPLVVCLDKSGSMEGERDVWATSVALALLDVAQAEKRPFALLCFDAYIKHEAIVMPGGALPEAALFVPADGGTDIDRVVTRGLEIIEQHPGVLRAADLVLVTDGVSCADQAVDLRARAGVLGVSILGVAIDVEPGALAPWCDTVVAAHDMQRLDDATASALFAGGQLCCSP